MTELNRRSTFGALLSLLPLGAQAEIQKPATSQSRPLFVVTCPMALPAARLVQLRRQVAELLPEYRVLVLTDGNHCRVLGDDQAQYVAELHHWAKELWAEVTYLRERLDGLESNMVSCVTIEGNETRVSRGKPPCRNCGCTDPGPMGCGGFRCSHLKRRTEAT